MQDYGEFSAVHILHRIWMKIMLLGGTVLHFHRIRIPNGFIFVFLTVFSFSCRKLNSFQLIDIEPF